MKHHYGIKNTPQIKQLADQVCDVLGHGKDYAALDLLVETAAAETQCGLFKDPTPNGAGYGLTQFDKIGFDDVQARTRIKDSMRVIEHFNINIKQVEIEDLANNPLLALIFTRLKYKLRPEPIPGDVMSRAVYWKRFYNSSAGKGTIQHYIESAERHLYNQEEIL